MKVKEISIQLFQKIIFQQGLVRIRTFIKHTYTISATPYDIYLVNSSSNSNSVNITLPLISTLPNWGRARFVIADVGG